MEGTPKVFPVDSRSCTSVFSGGEGGGEVGTVEAIVEVVLVLVRVENVLGMEKCALGYAGGWIWDGGG